MEKLVEEGLARNIGVSNFNVRRIKKLMETAKIKASNIIWVGPFSLLSSLTAMREPSRAKLSQPSTGSPQGWSRQSRLIQTPYMHKQWSKENGVVLESYSPLGSKGAPQLSEPAIKTLAEKHNTQPANILISWQLARGVVVLPKSVTPERIASNFLGALRAYVAHNADRGLAVVNLDKEDVEALESAAASKPPVRAVLPEWGGVDIFEDKIKTKL